MRSGFPNRAGLVTDLAGASAQLAHSKAAVATGDWLVNNDGRVNNELAADEKKFAALGLSREQLGKMLDTDRDGKVSAQEVRNYLILHYDTLLSKTGASASRDEERRTITEAVNNQTPKELVQMLETLLPLEAKQAAKDAGRQIASDTRHDGQSAEPVAPAQPNARSR